MPRRAARASWSPTTSKKARASRPTWRSCARAGSCISRRVPAAAPRRWPRSIAMRSPELLRHAWAVASKDLLVELRSRTAIVSVATFVVLVLMVFNFGRDQTAGARAVWRAAPAGPASAIDDSAAALGRPGHGTPAGGTSLERGPRVA